MKYLKLFITLVVGAMTMNSFAAQTANIKITVTDENAPFSPSTYVIISQNDAVTADFKSGNNGEYTISYGNSNSLNMYVKGNGTDIYQSVEIPNINGLQIVFIANKNHTTYKMSFSNVVGNLKLMKGQTEIPVDEDYNLVCSQTEEEVTFTLVVEQPTTYERQVALNAWGTICVPESLTVVTGATMYQLVAKDAAQPTKVAAEVVAVNDLVPGKAYLFNATAANQVFTYFPGSAVTDSINNLGLVGTFTGITLQAEKWVVKGNSIVPAAVGSTVPQYRAYVDLADTNLPVDPSYFTTSAPGRRVFNVVGEVTALDAVKAEAAKAQKVMINGQMVIIRDGKMFNAQGAEL